MKKILFAILACVGLCFTGCKEVENLSGNWETTSLTVNGIAQQIAISNIEFRKEGNKWNVSGNSGVNTFFGSIKVTKTQIIMGDKIGMTKMMGDPAAQEFEDLFIQAIMTADSYSINGNKLTISNSTNKSTVEFIKK